MLTENVLMEFVSEISKRKGSSLAIDRDTDLISGGVVASLDLIELALFIERVGGVTINANDISPENFVSVDSILRAFTVPS